MSGIRILALAAGFLWALGVATPCSLRAAGRAPETHASPPAETMAAPRAEAPVDPALMKLGKSVYAETCSKCHQPNGRGVPGAFPPLAQNPKLGKLETLVKTIKSGHTGPIAIEGQHYDETMPAIGADLSAEQLAAVVTYVWNSWGNGFGGVTPKEVTDIVSKGTTPGR
jgi:cytochrome c oxidase subunit 2